MKKLTALLMVFVVVVSLCACSATTPAHKYSGTNEELEQILADIGTIPIATMGVSMIITDRAVELLDWCEVTATTEQELASSVKAYYDSLAAEAQDMFIEQVAVTVSGAANLANDELRAGMLESVGLSTKLTWSEKAFSLAAALDDQL